MIKKKMNKKYRNITETIHCDLDLEGPMDTTISMIELLRKKYSKKGYFDIQFVKSYRGEYYEVGYDLEGTRKETDKERDKRLENEKKERKKRKEKKGESERKLYEKLKKKYGN